MSVAFNEVPRIENAVQVRQGSRFVRWGENNTYPQMLIDVSNQSPKHKAILNAKQRFLGTLKIQSAANPREAERLMNSINASQSFDELFEDVKTDLLHFGGFALVWEWNAKGGCASIERLPFQGVRTNEELDYFWYRKDWRKTNKPIQEFAKFDDENRVGKQLIYYREPSAGLDVYPIPEYIAALKSIFTDAMIADFHQSNLSNGFFPGAIISFYNGEPEPEEKTAIERALNRKYSGTNNTGKAFITFNQPGANAVTVDKFDTNGHGEQFDTLNKKVQEDIFVAHNVTSPMLFGVRVEGQLGGRTEMLDAFELFNTMYAKPKQDTMCKFFSWLFEYNGLGKNSVTAEPLELFDGEDTPVNQLPTNPSVSPENKGTEQVDVSVSDVTYNGAQIQAAVDILAKVKEGVLSEEQAVVFLVQLLKLEPAIAQAMFSKTSNAIVKLSAQEYIEDTLEQIEKALVAFNVLGEDAELFEELDACSVDGEGNPIRKLAFADDTESSIIDAKVLKQLSKTPNATVKELGEALQMEEKIVSASIERLIKNGDITLKDRLDSARELTKQGQENITAKNPVTGVEVRYKYAKRIGVSGDDIMPTTRTFCRKMPRNRLFSRAEIDQVSKVVGWNVWSYRGGFYRDPKTNLTSKSCRHEWQQVIVKRK